MKPRLNLVLFVVLTLTAAVNSFAQEFTFTTSTTNITAAMARLDVPGLAHNLQAIIVATPLGTTQTSNQHAIGAWFYNDKWYIFNSDNVTLTVGLTFKVEVFLTPGANQFLHIITNSNLSGGSSYIDNPAPQ